MPPVLFCCCGHSLTNVLANSFVRDVKKIASMASIRIIRIIKIVSSRISRISRIMDSRRGGFLEGEMSLC